MCTSTAIRLALVSLLAASCATEDREFPTRGLRPAQLESTFFLEKQAVLDLRLGDRSPSRREQVMHKRFRFGEGWSNAEPSGRWALGTRSALSVYTADPEGLSLFIECQGTEVQLVQVLVNGVAVGQIQPTSKSAVHVFELHEDLLRPGVNSIEFAFQSPTNLAPQLRLPASLTGASAINCWRPVPNPPTC